MLDAPSADWFLVSARSSGDVTDAAGISLFRVRRDAPGLTLFPYPPQSGGRAADLQLQNIAVDGDALIGRPDQALDIVERAVDLGIAALCAEALGIATALNQGDLGSFENAQTVRRPHPHLPGAATSHGGDVHRRGAVPLHGNHRRPARRRRGCCRTPRRAISGAKAYVGQALRFVGQQAVQLHGAMGVVDEHSSATTSNDSTMIDMTFGDAAYHLARFSDSPGAETWGIPS